MKIKPIVTLLIIFSFCMKSRSQCNCNCDVERDSLALVAFYYSTNTIASTIPWNLSTPMSNWSGVTLNSEGCVTKLQRENDELSGVLPPEIGNLECLTDLRLAWNEIGGEIPNEITNLLCLTNLSLSINEFTGEIPPEIGNLQNIEVLGLNINKLTGKIPNGIGNLVNLTKLALNDNKLEGCIPDEFQIFCGIEIFNLSGNFGVAFLGNEEHFCNGENQIGSECWVSGQFGTIGDDCNCIFTSSTSEIADKNDFKVFPSPFSQELSVESNQTNIREVRVYDAYGIIKVKQKQNQTACKIDMKGLISGIYFIEVLSENGSKVYKTMKE